MVPQKGSLNWTSESTTGQQHTWTEKVSRVAQMKLTAVNEFHWLRTGESHQAEQNDQTSPDIHVSLWCLRP